MIAFRLPIDMKNGQLFSSKIEVANIELRRTQIATLKLVRRHAHCLFFTFLPALKLKTEKPPSESVISGDKRG